MNGSKLSAGWGERVRLPQWDNIAFWLYVLLILNGSIIYFGGLFDNAANYPTALTFALVLELLFALPFVWFFIRRDRFDRQHGVTAALVFLWGGLVATWVIAVPGNRALLTLYSKLISVDFATSWGAMLAAPIVEESAKYIGIVMIVLLARNRVRSMYDGVILGAFAGLGFQVFENYQYMLNEAAANFGTNEVGDVISVFFSRTVTGVFSHALYSAIAGAGLGYFMAATDKSLGRRIGVASGLLVLAMALHASLDSLVAIGSVAILICGGLSTIGIVVVWRFADRRQRNWVDKLLADDVAAGTVTEDELKLLTGKFREMKHGLEAIKTAGGTAAKERAEAIFDAQVELADAIAATGDQQATGAVDARARIAELRAKPV